MEASISASADTAHVQKKVDHGAAAVPTPAAHGPAGHAMAPPPPKLSAIRWRSVFRWAAYLFRVTPGLVLLETAMTLAGSLLVLYNLQVVATVIGLLTQKACTGADCPAARTPHGLIGHLLPRTGETAVIVFAAVTVFLLLLTYATRVLTAYVDNRMVGRLRQDVHDRLLTFGPTYFESFDSGQATLLVTSFVPTAQTMLNEVITGPIVRLVSMGGALYFLALNLNTLQQQDRLIHAIFLVGLVGLPIIGWFLSVRLRASFAKARDSQAQLAEEFMNSMFRPSEIQLMGAAPQRARAFAERVQVQARDQVAAAARRELALDFQNAMPGLLQAVILIYGIFVALRGGSPATAGAAIFGLYVFVPQAIAPIQNVLQFAAGFTSSWPYLEAVINVLEAEPDDGGHDGTIDIGPSDRSVTFKDVTFAYAPDRPKILDGVSHEFPAGKITAVVARFGTGKSTALNLIARLRRPQSGTILIADKDLQQVRRGSLRQNLVKVSQFPLFIAASARENFRLAKADVTDAEIEAACRRTGLWDVLVKETPPGGDPLDYRVSRRDDIGLTGGQRRMFAVTRALLLEPTVLLLDEPTTGVDPIGRHEIYEMLAKACAGLTVVVVDQDFNFITHFAHEVCCLEGGKFVDVGSPAELMARPSLFQRLSQASQQ
jgi:ATP-binding cassette subfamily B protein